MVEKEQKEQKKKTKSKSKEKKTEAKKLKEENKNQSSVTGVSSKPSFDVLLYPITTEKVISTIESLNQLVFAVKLNSTKKQIKEEFERLFNLKVKKVNTKISPKGVKYAYIKLKEGKADDIAMQLKMI
ncbi:MAG: 50S ribosomal protein L23 [Candidatus Micrarchaeota archaeon]|nr:50S ribosomal protein L23 [Candidatus Micrarchaeota archaeon]